MKTGFPSEYLEKNMTVLSLFCAAFLGEQDVKFLQEAGIKDVVLVDLNNTNLHEMNRKYKYPVACFDILKALEEDGKLGRYDLVICDQWSNQDEAIHTKYLEKLKSMAKKYLFLSCTEAFLKGERPEGEYFHRSDYLGGVYWRVIKL